MPLGTVEEFLDDAGRRDRLELPLELDTGLPRRLVMNKQHRPDRLRHVDLDDGKAADPATRVQVLADLQVVFSDSLERPLARNRGAAAVLITSSLVDHLIARPKQLSHLVVPTPRNRLLQRHHIGVQVSQSRGEHATPGPPVAIVAEDVERQHPHVDATLLPTERVLRHGRSGARPR
jgi:hypothetical protein